MRRKSLILMIFAIAVVAGPAMAQEIVYFTNGTSMPVRSHEIEDGIIYVVLDSSASLAFPMDQVDRIETADGQLFQDHLAPTNQVTRPQTVAAPVSGSVPSRLRRGKWESSLERQGPGVETDSHGVAVTRPSGTAWGANRRRLKNSGDRSILSQPPASTPEQGVIGTTRYGTHNVLPGKGGAHRTQIPVGLKAGGNGTPPPPPPKKK